jgi:hypothetical protein
VEIAGIDWDVMIYLLQFGFFFGFIIPIRFMELMEIM